MAYGKKYRHESAPLTEGADAVRGGREASAPEEIPVRRSRLLCEISDGEPRRSRTKGTVSVEKREEPAPSLEVDGSPACAILSVRPVGEGEWVGVILSVPAGETGVLCAEDQVRLEKDGGYRVDLHLTVEQYAALRPVRGGVTSEQATALLEAGRLSAAIRRGMGLLAGSSSSQRGLESKLVTKGISRESASRAAAYLAEEGYIREADTATLRVEQGLRKGWGPRRIREDLRAKGFGQEAVEAAMESIADVDHTRRLGAVIRKKYATIPTDRREREKMIAALMRLGYDAATVRNALSRMKKTE